MCFVNIYLYISIYKNKISNLVYLGHIWSISSIADLRKMTFQSINACSTFLRNKVFQKKKKIVVKRWWYCIQFQLNCNVLHVVKKMSFSWVHFNADLGGLFRGSFWGGLGGGGKTTPPPCLKLVRVMLETSHLARKYTSLCSFRKYTF